MLSSLWASYKIYIIVGAVLAGSAGVFWFGGSAIDAFKAWLYDRDQAELSAENKKLAEEVRVLDEKYKVARAKIEEQAKALKLAIYAQDEKEREDARKNAEDLERTLVDIENTPEDEQLEALCREDAQRAKPRDWPFCREANK